MRTANLDKLSEWPSMQGNLLTLRLKCRSAAFPSWIWYVYFLFVLDLWQFCPQGSFVHHFKKKTISERWTVQKKKKQKTKKKKHHADEALSNVLLNDVMKLVSDGTGWNANKITITYIQRCTYVTNICTWLPRSAAQPDACLTGDQEVARSRLRFGTILSLRLIKKSFIRSVSPFRWFKKGSCQLLAKKSALSTG